METTTEYLLRNSLSDQAMAHSARLESLLAQAPVALYACDPNRGFAITFASTYVTDLTGYMPEELLDEPYFLFDRIHPDDLEEAFKALQRLRGSEWGLRKYRFRMKNGHWKWLRDRTKLIVDEMGESIEIIGAWTDISELVQIEDALRSSEEKQRFLLEHINVGVQLYTPEGQIVYSNPQASQLLGYTEQQLLLMSEEQFEGLFLNEHGVLLTKLHFPVRQVLNNGSSLRDQVFGIKQAEGQASLWVVVNAFPQYDEMQNIVNVIVTFLDVSERIKAQEEIHQLAHYDPLTQLPNRFLINLRIEQALQYARREKKQFALLFLDLDDFKLVNDTLGHHAGDALLNQIADRLRHCLREWDMVGRLGGDEFVVLLNNVETDGAAHVARKIIHVLKQSFDIGGQLLTSRSSIGISLYPHHGADVETLTKHADIAMYHAKAAGRGEYQFFEERMITKIEQRALIIRDIYQALQQNQFLLHYQPQVDARSGQIVGVEALIRWQHPERGMISPLDFIPVAEQSQQIQMIGLWVFRQACNDCKAWQALGLPPVKVAINLSFRQLQEPRLVSQIMEIINDTGVSPDCLEFELTESVMMENRTVALNFMKQCRAIGIHFSIDDFGTGYSSLSYLTKLPLSKIKIDRAFVKDIMQGGEANTIVGAIVCMAKSLRLKVVAEGAETLEQIEYLQSCGCEIIQGYYYSSPVAFEEITGLLKAGHIKRLADIPSFGPDMH